MSGHPFETDLDKNSANYIPLTPLSFIGRCARTFPTRPSVIYGDKVFTWEETFQRCLNLASALKKRGIGIGDTVSIMACLLYTSPSPRDRTRSRMPSSA